MFKNQRRNLLCTIVFLFTTAIFAQDTVLVDIIRIPYSVKSIAADKKGTIYMSGAKGLEKFSNPGHREVIDPNMKEAIYSEGGNIVPASKVSDNFFDSILEYEGLTRWYHFLPFIAPQTSVAQDKDGRYWIAAERFIYLFKIENRFKQTFKGKSIRGILFEQNNSFVQTYQGIFTNNQPIPGFKLGEGTYLLEGKDVYMSTGSLFRLKGPDFKTIDTLFLASKKKYRSDPDYHGVLCLDKHRDTIWVAGYHLFGYLYEDRVINLIDTFSIEALAHFQDKAYFCLNNGPVYSYSSRDGLKKETSFPARVQTVQSLNTHLALGTTNNGLFLFDGEMGRYIRKADGLANDNCYHVLKDEFGHWWVSTMSGLTRFSPDWSLSETYLPSVEFNRRAYYSYDGILSFGSVNGVYSFHPSEFEEIEVDDSILAQSMTGWLFIIVITLGLLVIILAVRLSQVNRSNAVVDHSEDEKKMLLNATKNFIKSHTGPLTLAQLAEYMDYSERHLYRLFDDLGMKAGDVLREAKLEHVHNKMIAGEMTLKQAAEEVGYTERYFKKLYDQFLEQKKGRS